MEPVVDVGLGGGAQGGAAVIEPGQEGQDGQDAAAGPPGGGHGGGAAAAGPPPGAAQHVPGRVGAHESGMLRGAAGEDLAEPRLDPLEVLVPCGKDAGLGEHVAHVVQGGGLGLLVEQGVGELPVMGCLGRSAQGWDLAFATNHLGPLAFTEALIPHVPDGANVVFTCSGVEDPERKPARGAGFRGGRYISAEASARGEWAPGGSSKPGMGAYATCKQCELATVFAVAREMPRLRFNAVEPGFSPGTGLGRDAADGIELSAGVLDRIDQIVPPAVTINVADNMWNIGTTALDTAFRRR